MVEFLSSLWENGVHMVDSPSNEDSKNIFPWRPYFRGDGRRSWRKWVITDTSIVIQVGQ